jgi:hypothetical protein
MTFDSECAALHSMELDARVLSAGCCGMAGSFGFEADKYAISRAVGERALLPELRQQEDDTIVMADGFSCRTQIAQGTQREALHIAEVMKLALESGEDGPARGIRPERSVVEQRRSEVRKSMIVAATQIVVVLVRVTAVVLSFALRG